VKSECKGRIAIVLCTLERPDDKLLPLYFLAATLRDLGATHVLLVAPYLAYMRQDHRFHAGEGITAMYFASLLSIFIDGLITVDPHLHRIQALREVYSVPSKVVHAAPAVANWIRANLSSPVLIGPDSESHQWVSDVAGQAGVPFTVLEKVRHGDREVDVSIPGSGGARTRPFLSTTLSPLAAP
jgi:ribose-phosphate pyrophosphokinase